MHKVAPEHAENVIMAASVNTLCSNIPVIILVKLKSLKLDFNEQVKRYHDLFVDFIHHLGRYEVAGRCLFVFDDALL